MKYLFIGGETDGQQIELDDEKARDFVRRSNIGPFDPSNPPENRAIKLETYYRQSIRINNEPDIWLYIIEGMSFYHAIYLLTQHYKPFR